MTLLSRVLRMARIASDFRARREIARTMPIRLWLESSSRCNLKCPMCLNKDVPAADKGNMDFDLFRKVIDEARGFVRDVYLHHRGEPLLNPRFFDMISCAREAGIKTRFHTNGTLLDEKKCEQLLDAGPNLVSFSIDGFRKDIYERIRVGASFDETIGNALRLLRRKRARRLKLPCVVIERISFREPDPPDAMPGIRELRRRFLEEGADEVIDKREYDWAVESAARRPDARPRSVCTFPWYAAVICWDGTVTPCPQDYMAAMKMGNATISSLREIWNGDAYRDLRKRLAAGAASLPLCRNCDRLARKTFAGVPVQYMAAFLADQVIGYNKLRRAISTSERN